MFLAKGRFDSWPFQRWTLSGILETAIAGEARGYVFNLCNEPCVCDELGEVAGRAEAAFGCSDELLDSISLYLGEFRGNSRLVSGE